MNKKTPSAFRYAWPKTIPVLAGYLFLGTAYGILMAVNGFDVRWTLACSVFVFAGSLQYVGVTMLSSIIHPLTALLMSLIINARHMFYGVSMLHKFEDVKKGRPYLIFGMSDETFTLLVQEDVPEQYNKDNVYLWITALDQLYWIIGSVTGAILGSLLNFNSQGLDFALTALFVVTLVEQWKKKEGHLFALIGIIAPLLCLLIFGASDFIIPAMVLILICMFAVYTVRSKANGNREGGAA